MNRRSKWAFIAATAATTLFLLFFHAGVDSVGAQELALEKAVICTGVEDRAPVDPGNSFPVSVGRLYCFTQIAATQTPTEITHVWYFGDNERARVTLAVGGSPWRTYSSKLVQPHEVGPWRVDILDATGRTVDSVRFDLTP